MANTEELGKVSEKLGADVIYSYKDSASQLAKKILSNNILDFISLNDEIEICKVKIPNKYIGKSILNCNIRKDYGLNIIALEFGDGIIETNIDPQYEFKNDDAIVVIQNKKSIRKFEGK